jgi:hypothetical protein
MAFCNVKFYYLSLIGTHHVTISAGINYRSQSGLSRQLLHPRLYVRSQHESYSSGRYIRFSVIRFLLMNSGPAHSICWPSVVSPIIVGILTVPFVLRNCSI